MYTLPCNVPSSFSCPATTSFSGLGIFAVFMCLIVRTSVDVVQLLRACYRVALYLTVTELRLTEGDVLEVRFGRVVGTR